MTGSHRPVLVDNDVLKDMKSACSKPLHQNKPQCVPNAWAVVDKEFFETNSDRNLSHLFWWHSTGVPFAILLEKAGYLFEEQLQHLMFYHGVIVPELGDGPHHDGTLKHWKSFMTDHHSPVEFSWAWNRGTELPVIRYSFEPIGEAAGTLLDPANQYAALRFVANQHGRIEGCDLSWFNHLWQTLIHFNGAQRLPRSTEKHLPGNIGPSRPSHKSRSFLAVELNKTGPMLKAYYMPVFKAAAVGRSTMSVINDGISGLPGLPRGVRDGHKKLLEFLQSNSQGRSLIPEIVATDCIAPEKSRVKIYMRSQSTSLESVIETFCLGDHSVRQRRKRSLEEFTRLWNLVFGLPSEGDTQNQLSKVSHRTGGMLYYFGLGGEKGGVTVKVYLPVRHYAKGDREAAVGLQEYIRTTSAADFSDNYVDAIEEIMWVHNLMNNIAFRILTTTKPQVSFYTKRAKGCANILLRCPWIRGS